MAEFIQSSGRRGVPWRLVGWGGAVALLAAPFVAMQLDADGVDWSPGDFVVMGAMLAIVGGLIELAVRSSGDWSYRGGVMVAVFGGFLLTWANLAVGIVGNENSPANQLFFAALLVGIVGSLVARGRPAGMAVAMLMTAGSIVAAFVLAQAAAGDVPGMRLVVEGAGTTIFVALFGLSAWLFRRAAPRPQPSSST